MVFLRLTVKICPREQIQSGSSFPVRSSLDDRGDNNNNNNNNNNTHNGGGNSNGRDESGGLAGSKPTSFLLVLEDPADVSLGGLAGMIQDKWKKLRPHTEPLQIKKLVDDEHESDDLDADMTVADVFVDNGLSRKDARDQRGTVRVIQKPTPYAPARFPSVSLDWDAAAEDYERQAKAKKEAASKSVHKFPAIPEEEPQREPSVTGSQASASQQDVARPHTPAGRRADQDALLMSVERDDVILGSLHGSQQTLTHEQGSQGIDDDDLEATSYARRMQSQELGGSPMPTFSATHGSQKRLTKSRSPTPASVFPDRVASDSRSPSPDANELAIEMGVPADRRMTRAQLRQLQGMPQDEDDQGIEDMGDFFGDDYINHFKDENEDERRNEKHDRDDDITIEEGHAAGADAREQPQANDAVVAQASAKDTNGDTRETRLGKRKKSHEDLQSNKEPRLNETGGPATTNKDQDVPSTQETEHESTSPHTVVQPEQSTPVASRLRHRPNNPEPRRPGSPGNSKATKAKKAREQQPPHASQTSTTATPATPATSGSAPTASQDNLTPSKSALRKGSPEKSPGCRLSVSFAEGTNVLQNTDPKPQPTPRTDAKESKESKPNGSALSSSTANTSTANGPSQPGKIVYPAGFSQDVIERIMLEENQKKEREAQQTAEFQEKIRNAETQKADPKYLRQLQNMYSLWQFILKHESTGRQKIKGQVDKARNRLAGQWKELEKFEAKDRGNGSSKPAAEKAEPSKQASEKKPDPSKPPARTNGAAKQANGGGQGTPAPATKETPKQAPKEPPKKSQRETPKETPKKTPQKTSPETPKDASNKQALQAKPLSNGNVESPSKKKEVQASSPVATSSQPQRGLSPEVQVVPASMPQPKPQEQEKPPQPKPVEQPQQAPQAPQAQQSKPQAQGSASDDVTVTGFNTISPAKQPKNANQPSSLAAPQQPSQRESIEISSDEESESESESESEDDDDEKNPGSVLTKADLLGKSNGTNQSSAKNNATKSPAPPSQQRQAPSQTQPPPQQNQSNNKSWGSHTFYPQTTGFQAINKPPYQASYQPAYQPAKQQTANWSNARTSLQGLKDVLESQMAQHRERVEQVRPGSTRPSNEITEAQSQPQAQAAGDSDDDSESNSDESADEGDIQSSGCVGKLRRALQKRK